MHLVVLVEILGVINLYLIVKGVCDGFVSAYFLNR